MKIYGTSDQHFTHSNIIKYANRPFANIDECTNTIIRNYNEIVEDDDIVLFIGDLAHGRSYTEQSLYAIISSMKGKKILFKGNHDNFSNCYYQTMFDDVFDYLIIEEYFINHYSCYKSPWTTETELLYRDIIKDNRCTQIIHGHIHNKDPSLWVPDGYNRTNVCVDFEPNKYYPVPLTSDKIINYFKKYK